MTVLVVGVVDGFLERGPRLVLLGAVVQAPSLGLARVGRERERGHSQVRPSHGCARNSACILYIRTIRSTQSEELRKASKASKASPLFGLKKKASMVGFTLLSRSYYYLRTVDEVPAPRSRPTTVRQGNGGLQHQQLKYGTLSLSNEIACFGLSERPSHTAHVLS